MRHNDDDAINATFETVAGTAALIVTGFAAAVMFPAAEPAARVLVVAVTVGVLSARFTDWRACAGVAVIAALVFVGFLAHQYGVLTGEPTPWSFTPLIGFAALLGRGYRRLASFQSDSHGQDSAALTPSPIGAASLFVWPEAAPADRLPKREDGRRPSAAGDVDVTSR